MRRSWPGATGSSRNWSRVRPWAPWLAGLPHSPASGLPLDLRALTDALVAAGVRQIAGKPCSHALRAEAVCVSDQALFVVGSSISLSRVIGSRINGSVIWRGVWPSPSASGWGRVAHPVADRCASGRRPWELCLQAIWRVAAAKSDTSPVSDIPHLQKLLPVPGRSRANPTPTPSGPKLFA